MRYLTGTLLLMSCAASLALPATAAGLSDPQQLQLKKLSQATQTDYSQLQQAIKLAQKDDAVITAITKPWEAKPWYQYQGLFIQPKRIQQGVEFWKQHHQALMQAEKTYQVPAQIIVAIIGVETFYGRFKGNYPVLDSLYTLGFHYPPRGAFFQKEFAAFVRLSHQQNWQLRDIKGSYAGAMGFGQFIPSSYLHYAVDFNHDGHINMLTDPEDAIGSVANYFHQHGWIFGQPVATAQTASNPAVLKMANRELKTRYSWQQLATAGAMTTDTIAPQTSVNLLSLQTEKQQSKTWVTFDNFYVITRYNHSPLYAMAVYQLSQQIKNAYQP
ncbi:lytic murein transglycosylase B [Celerinatantimonas sp. YJH-8]|uniref:lytic murein transglycosylase B n=1 Tax=Celerinatantimonas sp. YJH-8 TaxID=3228714 RepID=UPI0038C87866